MNWLYWLPEPLMLLASVTTVVLLIVFLPRLLGRVPLLAPNAVNSDFVLRLQNTLFTMTGLVLTFTLVQADNNFRRADAAVSAEATQIDQLDRLLSRYGDPEVTAIRPQLHRYAQSIVTDEWPDMLRQHGNPATARAFTPISRRILAISPNTTRESLIFAEMLKSLDAIAESRGLRLNTFSLGLPAAYWEVVLFAIAMLVFVGATIEQTPFRVVVLAAQTAVVGAFVGFVFIMDQPYRGQTSVSPDAIVKVIANMHARAG